MPASYLSPLARLANYAAHLLAAGFLINGQIAYAAPTTIADEPLITQGEFKPKPNLMVILDDSVSMDSEYIPDKAGYSSLKFGRYSTQCNGLAYDPNINYLPPLKPDGTFYPNADFLKAPTNGFSDTSTVTDLSANTVESLEITTDTSISPTATSFTLGTENITTLSESSFPPGEKIKLKSSNSPTLIIEGTVDTWTYLPATQKGTLTLKEITNSSGTSTAKNWRLTLPGRHYYRYLGNLPKMSYEYDSNGTLQNNAFFNECDLVYTSKKEKIKIAEHNSITTQSPLHIQTNYANWYSYYRTRRLLMRTAMGRSFNPLNDDYRIGFVSINNSREAAREKSVKFLPVTDFNAEARKDFYNILYTAPTNSSGTPLRTALANIGKYFSKNLPSQKTDPMQYACQRNYALLTTDGYWNQSFKDGGLNNSDIGDSDGDGAIADGGMTSLADVAHYYYTNDLRTNCPTPSVPSGPKDVCANILIPAGKDDARHQHMVTFTIGLGITGTLPQSVIPKTWPPVISKDHITTADDLWHAAVNGRGDHYSAQNVPQLTEAIQGIVTTIQNVTGAGSATSTSTLELVQGDGNIAFEASYTTGSWVGDVVAREMDPITAKPREGEPRWSARAKLETVSAASRRIYFRNATMLSDFTWDNLGSTLKAHFQNACSASPVKLTQCATLSEAHQASINEGSSLVAYLRGDRSRETTSATAPLFRERKARLGDIINSKPIHVGAPPFDYGDGGYAEFKAAQAARRKVLYFGANDGMLHAVDAGTGEELWAYIPTAVMPNLHKLADVKYGSTIGQPHVFFVDGKTVQGDVKIGDAWKTILVGGLNKGGRAYYALDITNPDEPKSLWEFAHNDSIAHENLGLSYGEPVISKLENGTWTVAFGSGYNNVSPGDGKGRLFVVNAATGAIERNIATAEGSTATPSGLAKINVWRKSSNDNTAQRFYGGDLLGKLWRFDVDRLVQPYQSAMVLAQMLDASGTPQPITTEPKLREYDKQPLIAVATGRYLGRSDIDDKGVQSIAAIRDPLTPTGWGVVRTHSAFKKVTVNKSGNTASGSAETVDWRSGAGWWTDFPTAGERVALPMEWDGPRLLVAATLPDGDQCVSGGSSWLYSFGLAGGVTHGEQFRDNSLIVGFSVVTNAKGAPKILVRTSDNKTAVRDGTGLGGAPIVKPARRVSWRELH